MQMPCQGVVMGIKGISSMTKWQNCHTSDISRTDKNVILLSLCHMTDVSLYDISHINVGSDHL